MKIKKFKDVAFELVRFEPNVKYTKPAAALILILLVYSLIDLSLSIKNAFIFISDTLSKEEQYVAIPNSAATGGADFSPLGDMFILGGAYVCDDEHWRLDGERAIARYATSTDTGSVFQFDFIPTGKEVANIQFGRDNAYELSLGANSYQHLQLINLADDSFVGLYDEQGGLWNSRLNMGATINSSTMNTVRIEEVVLSENLMKLKITLNEMEFESTDFQVNNHRKHKGVYIGMLDLSKFQQNKTGLIIPELRICK